MIKIVVGADRIDLRSDSKWSTEDMWEHDLSKYKIGEDVIIDLFRGEKIGNKIVDEYMKEMGKPCSKLEELVDKFCSVVIE